MPGADAPAAARVVVVNTRVSHHGHTGFTRHSPRNGFTAYFVLSPATGLSCHRRPRKLPFANLTPASGRQDHTTSPSASAPFVKGAAASTASRPNVRDDGQRPSEGQDGGGYRFDLGRRRSEIFLQMRLDRPNQLDPL
jgi:hypothetical protein